MDEVSHEAAVVSGCDGVAEAQEGVEVGEQPVLLAALSGRCLDFFLRWGGCGGWGVGGGGGRWKVAKDKAVLFSKQRTHAWNICRSSGVSD